MATAGKSFATNHIKNQMTSKSAGIAIQTKLNWIYELYEILIIPLQLAVMSNIL